MELFNNNIPIHNVKNVALSGLTDEVFCRYINNAFSNNDKSILIVTPSLFDVEI